MNRKITAHYTLVGGQLRSNIVVEVDSSRRIVSVVESEVIDSMAGVEFYPGILIPGMVNLHCHLELAYLRGAIEEQTGFAGFARAIGMVRDKFTIEERLHAASVADSAMWQEGIEAVLDIANDEMYYLFHSFHLEFQIIFHQYFDILQLLLLILDLKFLLFSFYYSFL